MKHYTVCIDCGNTTGNYQRKRCDSCHKSNKSKLFSGEGNGRWNGGKMKNTGGYTELNKNLVEKEYHYLTDCRGYIREHRLVAAKKYNRKIDKKEIVHHLNGIRTDNRPENLVIVDSSKHERHTFERILQDRIRELENMVK